MKYTNYLFLLALPFLLMAQLPEGVSYIPESGIYHVSFRDSVNQRVYTWEFEPSTKLHPFLDVLVEYESNTGLYSYEYTVINGKNSQQNLIEFSLEYDGPYLQQSQPSKKWNLVSYFNLPLIGWNTNHSAENKDQSGIKPGDRVEEFILTSQSMPAIIACFFSGYSSTQTVPDGLPQHIENYFKELMEFPENKVRRWTIGPSAEIESLTTEQQLASLRRMTDQALSLEWIKTVRIYSNITNSLNETEDLIKIESKGPALNKLKQLLKNLDKDRGEHINNEAYFLYLHHIRHLERRLSG